VLTRETYHKSPVRYSSPLLMIHYNVWFSFKDTIADPEDELRKMRNFLGDLKTR